MPYQPDPESGSESEKFKSKAKKKSFMDDDEDDNFRTMRKLTSPPADSSTGDATARKQANDAAAEAAFRAAAEADAQRGKEQEQQRGAKGKVGWFGGWLGGKKPESLDSAPAPKGGDAAKTIHRAHLGESKMTLRYDENLKKWINPADPDSMKAKATPPPPPKMGLGPRGSTPSGSMPSMVPGSGPSSRSSTPADLGAAAGPLSSSLPRLGSSGLAGAPPTTATSPAMPSTGPPGLPAGIVPPSRPSTGMSGASDIDDLLNGAAASGRRTIKGKKGARAGRYVDVMAK